MKLYSSTAYNWNFTVYHNAKRLRPRAKVLYLPPFSFRLQCDIRSSHEEVSYNYDPFNVASMNRIATEETKISALLAFLHHLKWTKFVAVTDNDHESTSFVRKLEGHLHARNMEMIDWLLFTVDDSVYDRSLRFKNLGSDDLTFLLVTNNLTMAFNTFGGAFIGGGETRHEQWIVVSDLDVRTFNHFKFPPEAYSLTPKTNREITLSSFVDDAVRSISYSLAKRPHNMVSTCPKMNELRRWVSLHIRLHHPFLLAF